MALGFYFAPDTMTAEKYDECLVRLQKAGAAHPKGRRYHMSFISGDKVQVFDVWESQAAFDKFGQTLMPILQSLGVEPGQPMVSEIRRVIVPPAKPVARRPPPKKAPAPRKAKRKSRK